ARCRAARSSHGRSLPSSLLRVDLFDEPRELVRSGAYRMKRLLVVHPQRAEQGHRAERLICVAVRRTDEREVVQTGRLEFVADAGELPLLAERGREHVEERSAFLERIDQAAIGADPLGAKVV